MIGRYQRDSIELIKGEYNKRSFEFEFEFEFKFKNISNNLGIFKKSPIDGKTNFNSNICKV